MQAAPAGQLGDRLRPARTRRVIVGVDGSPSSAAALRWAVAHGGEEGAETVIEAVYAWQPLIGAPILTDGTDQAARAHRLALRATDDALAGALPAPAVEVRPRAEEGSASQVLLTAAAGADLLVVGNKGHSLMADVVTGSVGVRCAARSDCPVVLVPAPRR